MIGGMNTVAEALDETANRTQRSIEWRARRDHFENLVLRVAQPLRHVCAL